MTLLTQLNPDHDAPLSQRQALIGRMAYTNTRWRECVIWCACEGGTVREALADVYGVFAVHQAAPHEAQENWMWVLTHIPTGKYLGGSGWPMILEDYAVRLTALGDWNTTSMAKLKRLKEAM